VTNKERGDKLYDLSVRLTSQMKVHFRNASTDDLESCLEAYLKTLQTAPPEQEEDADPPTVEVSFENLQQMVLFAAPSVARLMAEKLRAKR